MGDTPSRPTVASWFGHTANWVRRTNGRARAGRRSSARSRRAGHAGLAGVARAPVHRRPVVGVFSTGDELVDPGNALALGQIYDSNRPTLLAAVALAGGTPLDLGIVRDRPGEWSEPWRAAWPKPTCW